MNIISSSEQHYCIAGARGDCRADGRKRSEYRPFRIQVGLLQQANGSARLRLGQTDVVVGVKAQMGTPVRGRPNEGCVMVGVEWSASASPEYAGRGGEDLSTELQGFFSDMLTGEHGLDRQTLCIIPGQLCWHVYIDAVVLDCDGNTYDALSLAFLAALYDTKLPKVTVGGTPSKPELEVPDDPGDCIALDPSNIPTCVTFTELGASCFIVDATQQEELCSDARIMMAVDQNGNICTTHKVGKGGTSPQALLGITSTAGQVGTALLKRLRGQVEDARVLGPDDDLKNGFLSVNF